MKYYIIVSCLIYVCISAPLNHTNEDILNFGKDEAQNEVSFNVGFLLSPSESEEEPDMDHISNLFELLFPILNKKLSEGNNSIFAYDTSKENKTENEPYTFFESEMDPSDPKNFGKDEEFGPLKISFSSFPLWDENTSAEDATTEKTPPRMSYKDILPDILSMSAPPTLEDEQSHDAEISKKITDDILTTEANIETLEDKAKKFLLSDKEAADLYESQAKLIDSMEVTLKSLKTYIDKQSREQEKGSEYNLNNVLVIVSVGAIYLLIICTFFSFKSTLYGDGDKEEKEDMQSELLSPIDVKS